MLEHQALPKVVVITINYNQTEYTNECIKSLFNSDYKSFEIILVDNGSELVNFNAIKNELYEFSESNLHLKRLNNNVGYVKGINFGLSEAAKLNPDFILILNNDTLIDSSSIRMLVEVAETHSRKAIVSGKVFHYHEEDILQYIGQYKDPDGGINQQAIVDNQYEKDKGQYDIEMEVGMLDDIFWLIPMKLYESIGGYSEYFYLYGEQNDYALRAISSGFKLIYTPQAKLWHKGGITTSDGDKKSARIEYWKKMAVLKLSILHLNKERATSFFRKWFLRESIKSIIYFLIHLIIRL